ncbi:ABC transporter ATP-binding protein [Kocuria rhizophila]|nr:ABC transporter ATP-binding protein [Kocuria rhizophila]
MQDVGQDLPHPLRDGPRRAGCLAGDPAAASWPAGRRGRRTTLLDMVLGMANPPPGAVSVCRDAARGRGPREGGRGAAGGGLLRSLSVRDRDHDRVPLPGPPARGRGAGTGGGGVVRTPEGGHVLGRAAAGRVRSPWPCSRAPSCSCWTSQPRAWTCSSAPGSGTRCARPSAGSRSCCRATFQEAEDVAPSRIVLMDAGRVTFDGSVDELRSTSRHHTVSFVWPAGEPLPEFAGATVSRRSESRVHLRTEDADALARELLTRTPRERDLRGGLDEAFAALVRHDDAAA